MCRSSLNLRSAPRLPDEGEMLRGPMLSMTRPFLPGVAIVAAIAAVGGSGPQRPGGAARDDGQTEAQRAVVESMSHHHMEASPHVRLTARWPERPGDRRRAEAIVAALRPAIEPYRDHHVALRNGYEIFMPALPQPVFHFTNYMRGFAETFEFRADQVTALLYRKAGATYE